MKSYIAAPVAIAALLFGVFSQDLRYLRFTTRQYQVEKKRHGVKTTNLTSENCTEPLWSDWFEDLSCNADCGACGTRILRRNCLTQNCQCLGEARREEVCSIKVCSYPKAACCPPYRLVILDGHFVCGPQSQEVASRFLSTLEGTSKSAEVDPIIPSIVVAIEDREESEAHLPRPRDVGVSRIFRQYGKQIYI
ncbi:unnamed protein product [Caenorhabditis auriculariae]|uniref:Uncharacterized protein n=1 Tax=Caenorhabditis auriculariae TaxID=2777116 RepID=A0A8S1GNJ2_9PELO|nr:unnamed protein product [Caenorhabditis auriculariae]